MKARTKARELALKALYAYEAGEDRAPDEVFDSLVVRSKLDKDLKKFARGLFEKATGSRESIDGRISELSTNWPIDRLTPIDRNILRISIAEFMAFPDVPREVLINEAVELAKRYGAKNSPAFINGVLDSYSSRSDSSGNNSADRENSDSVKSDSVNSESEKSN